MLTAQKVNDLVTSNGGKPICDTCICEKMGFKSHAHSAQITAALGTTSDFTRETSVCSLCGEERLAMRANRK